MDVQERNWAGTRWAVVELVELETADGCKGRENIGSGTRVGIGHHAAIGEPTAIDARTVYGIVCCDVFDDLLEEIQVFIGRACGVPSGYATAKHREILIYPLGIYHNTTFFIGYRSPERRTIG